jgi:hypothetical protein
MKPTAARKPEANAKEEPRPPWAANTEPAIATPRTTASSRIATVAPDACPCRETSTDPRAADVIGANSEAPPIPPISIPGTRTP